MNILSEYHLDCCLKELEDRVGIEPPTRNSLRNIITDQDFIDDMADMYNNNKTVSGLDTWERDMLFDMIANHFTNSNWPLIMDGPEKMKTFAQVLKVKLTEEDWAIV